MCSDSTCSQTVFNRESKPHSTPLTLRWLEENFKVADGVCIPRSTLYLHYLTFCQQNNSNPINAASFGKILRQKFPQISTRRLGTRGQSKYHYYGICIRDCTYNNFNQNYSNTLVSSEDGNITQNTNDVCSHIKEATTTQVTSNSPRSSMSNRLPEFPDVSIIKLPGDVEQEKVVMFLTMYRTHCQRIMDSVLVVNFDQVQYLMFHFWQDMPTHLASILGSEVMVKLVGICDYILYQAVGAFLMPSVLHKLPDRLSYGIDKFVREFEPCLRSALRGLPVTLKEVKLQMIQGCCQALTRQVSLSHLVQTARAVVTSTDGMTQLLSDWMNIDLSSIITQTLYTTDSFTDRQQAVILDLCRNFEKLLEEQVAIEIYLTWLDDLLLTCILQVRQKRGDSLRNMSRQFLLMWSCFCTRVARDMTLHSAHSFGSFHLLHLLFDDYILHLIESMHAQERINQYMKCIKGETTEDIIDDMVLDNPAKVKETFMNTCRTEQGHRRSFYMSGQSISTDHRLVNNNIFEYDGVGNSYSRDDGVGNSYSRDDGVGNSYSRDEDDALDRMCSAVLSVDTLPDVNTTCAMSINQSSYMGSTLHPYTEQQQQQQQPPRVQSYYNTNQTVISHHIHNNESLKGVYTTDYEQANTRSDYVVQTTRQNSQSPWGIQSRGRGTSHSGLILNSGQPMQSSLARDTGSSQCQPTSQVRNKGSDQRLQASLVNNTNPDQSLQDATARDTIYQSVHLTSSPSTPSIGHCYSQHNMEIACTSPGYHGSVSPEMITLSTGNSQLKRKHSSHQDIKQTVKQHVIGKSLTADVTGSQQYGLDLL